MNSTELNDSALLAPSELSNDDLDLVLGGNGPSGLQMDPPAVNVVVETRVAELSDTLVVEASARVVDAVIETVQSAGIGVENTIAPTIDVIADVFVDAGEVIGDVFTAIGDFFTGGGSGG